MAQWASPADAMRSYYDFAPGVEYKEPFATRDAQPFVASSPLEAVQRHIHPGMSVFVGSAAGTPVCLTDALAEHGPSMRGKGEKVRVVHIHTEGPGAYMRQPDVFETINFFTGPNAREPIAQGAAQYAPIFLSEIPLLFRRGYMPLDVAMVCVSPPDDHGFVSLGVSVDVVRSAVQVAKKTIAVVNEKMPRTHGDGQIHVSQIDTIVHVDQDLPELPAREPTEQEQAIGRIIADKLVQDGATLQMGIGAIPDAVLSQLHHHKNLGIHSEMFSDGVIDLVEKGVINNSCKHLNPGQLVGGFCIGSKRLYDFVHDNPFVRMRDIAYVNDTSFIRQNPYVVAMNSAIELDITGQCVADSIGTRIYSGVGGQLDFIRGASLCPTGVPIIAMPSTTSKGRSRIVPFVQDGGGVVTTRAHIHNVVTEYGAIDLFGKTLQERARLLISIAHPDHREELEKQAFERFKVM